MEEGATKQWKSAKSIRCRGAALFFGSKSRANARYALIAKASRTLAIATYDEEEEAAGTHVHGPGSWDCTYWNKLNYFSHVLCNRLLYILETN